MNNTDKLLQHILDILKEFQVYVRYLIEKDFRDISAKIDIRKNQLNELIADYERLSKIKELNPIQSLRFEEVKKKLYILTGKEEYINK